MYRRGILVRLVICVLPGHRKIKTEIIKLLAFFCLNPVKYMLFHWILTMGHLIPPVVDQLQKIIGIWLSRQNAGNGFSFFSVFFFTQSCQNRMFEQIQHSPNSFWTIICTGSWNLTNICIWCPGILFCRDMWKHVLFLMDNHSFLKMLWLCEVN